ncbi:hypothetical protein HYH03_006836 [Edaphochlamys debaryana]|uniref:Uncharacterized protein n=1 Tax=Edaphochlamys debaryana TaxID=47281 RepID=A0A835Y656_9CHLO|nr:hypothetical protein HYH03_006836 [Edaphochlamys debaryana]|eukprot:KAG2494901.1 hypothetical protein HYH03_006836 [Edaphochlamys debaryana]
MLTKVAKLAFKRGILKCDRGTNSVAQQLRRLLGARKDSQTGITPTTEPRRWWAVEEDNRLRELYAKHKAEHADARTVVPAAAAEFAEETGIRVHVVGCRIRTLLREDGTWRVKPRKKKIQIQLDELAGKRKPRKGRQRRFLDSETEEDEDGYGIDTDSSSAVDTDYPAAAAAMDPDLTYPTYTARTSDPTHIGTAYAMAPDPDLPPALAHDTPLGLLAETALEGSAERYTLPPAQPLPLREPAGSRPGPLAPGLIPGEPLPLREPAGEGLAQQSRGSPRLGAEAAPCTLRAPGPGPPARFLGPYDGAAYAAGGNSYPAAGAAGGSGPGLLGPGLGPGPAGPLPRLAPAEEGSLGFLRQPPYPPGPLGLRTHPVLGVGPGHMPSVMSPPPDRPPASSVRCQFILSKAKLPR